MVEECPPDAATVLYRLRGAFPHCFCMTRAGGWPAEAEQYRLC